MPRSTANWNDIPDDILAAPGRRPSSIRSSSIRSARSSQSPQPAPAPLNFRPGRAPPRAHQPRRRSGQLSRQPLAETTLPKPLARRNDESTWMSPYLSSNGTVPAVFPLKHVAERVGREVEEFAEKLDKWKAAVQDSDADQNKHVLELVGEYRQIASETVKRLRRSHGAAKRGTVKQAWKGRLVEYGFRAAISDESEMDEDDGNGRDHTTVDDLDRWQDELNTWTLMEALLETRLTTADPETSTVIPTLVDDDRFTADGQAWADFITSDKDNREKLVILKWLELISEETGTDMDIVDDYLAGSGSGTWSSGWLETREKLKAEKRIRMWDKPIDGPAAPEIDSSDGRQLVTQLDPDAPRRQQKVLEAADDEAERSLWLTCWLMFRRGASIDEIRHWLREYQQFDKALSLGAHAASETSFPAASVGARHTWRLVCQAAVEAGRLDRFERAVLGLLSGHLDSVQAISQTWEDAVYAITNATLLQDYRAFVVKRDPQLDSTWSRQVYGASDVVEDGADAKREKFITSLQHEAASWPDARQAPAKVIQASLIANKLGRVAFEQGILISRRAGGTGLAEIIPASVAQKYGGVSAEFILDSVDILRVLTHALIIERHIGSSDQDRSVSDVLIAGYVNYLLLAGKIDAIPLYCSLLSPEQSPQVLARVLATLTSSEQRAGYTRLMKEMGIDVLETLIRQFELAVTYSTYLRQDERTVTRLVLMETTNDPQWPGQRIQAFVEADILADEETIIRSMEWFEHVDGCWAQTFDGLKYITKRFLFAGRLQAAVELLHRMPPSRVSQMKTEAILGQSVDIMEYEAKDGEESILCQALRAEAQAYYDMDTLFAAIQAMWNWRETEDLRLKQNLSIEDVKHIKKQIKEAIETLGQAMYAVLQPGLLTTPSIVGVADTANMQQLRREEVDSLEMLRQAYLPEMILAYLTALYAAGEWHTREALLEALELTQVIATSPELTRCFTATGRMRELVEAFAQCSKKLLLLNERERRGSKKSSHEKRLHGGRTYAIFESKTA